MDYVDFFCNAVAATVKNCTLDEHRKNSKEFAAIDAICGILIFLAKNKISPNTREGKHYNIELQEEVDKFNNVFIEHGLNPNLSIDWTLC